MPYITGYCRATHKTGKLLTYDGDQYTLFHDRFRHFLVGEQPDPIAEGFGISVVEIRKQWKTKEGDKLNLIALLSGRYYRPYRNPGKPFTPSPSEHSEDVHI